MNEIAASQETLYVCAGICRVNPTTNRCAGCGRPWEELRASAPLTPPLSDSGAAEVKPVGR